MFLLDTQQMGVRNGVGSGVRVLDGSLLALSSLLTLPPFAAVASK